MCEKKAVLLSLSKFLLVAASFCIYQAHTATKVGHHSETKSQCSRENECKKYCLNSRECFYLAEDDILGCDCTRLYGGKPFEKYMWWD